ncbi:MAG: 2-C-methyl-D-erythritol 4-phosphate cytidylyltransferase [Hungatella sp.]
MKDKVTAIVLAAGQGRRMESDIQKQYMELNGRPLIYYALRAFEESTVDEIILVVGSGEKNYCQTEIVEAFGFGKVMQIVEGGRERYHSVYEGLRAIHRSDYVLIHDGARPCVTGKIIEDAIAGAKTYGACAVGMPVKDTIKIADGAGFAESTPDRSRVWMIQTPQAFSYSLIDDAYSRLLESESNPIGVTDDAMVVESMTLKPVKLIRGSYENLKVTTPEDLLLAGVLLSYLN